MTIETSLILKQLSLKEISFQYKEKSILDKYNEELEGVKKKSFKLGKFKYFNVFLWVIYLTIV